MKSAKVERRQRLDGMLRFHHPMWAPTENVACSSRRMDTSTLRAMFTPPIVKPSDLIEITGSHPIPAIVASVAFEDTYEVVYFDDTGKAVAEEVQWVDGAWKFLHLTPSRIDAEHLERLQPFVKLLRERPRG